VKVKEGQVADMIYIAAITAAKAPTTSAPTPSSPPHHLGMVHFRSTTPWHPTTAILSQHT
jgi:hypothetical protein